MMIDFRIDTFLAVCRNMNYTKAAAELNITQPAVSQHIRYLEGVYQTKLFDYNNKKIGLTDTGRMLQDAAVTMKHDERSLKTAILEKNEVTAALNFGVTLTIGEYCIPKQVAAYVKEHPGSRIKVVVNNTKELLGELNRGEIDFAIVEGNFAKNEYDSELYSRQELVSVCAYNHRFEREPERLEDILRETLLIREKKSGGREVLERSLEGKNLSIADFGSSIEVSSIKTIKELVKQDCGISFLYEAAVEEDIRNKQLRKIELKDFSIWHDMMFIWRKNSIYTDHYRDLFRLCFC